MIYMGLFSKCIISCGAHTVDGELGDYCYLNFTNRKSEAQRSQVISQSWYVIEPGPCQIWGKQEEYLLDVHGKIHPYSPAQQSRPLITVIYVRKILQR